MKNEEIDELYKLKGDRDHLRLETRDVKHMEREYSDGCGRKPGWLNKLVNPKIKLAHDAKKGMLKASGHMESFVLDTDNYDNEVVQTRVREIQAKVSKLVAAEVDKLDKDITKALKDYDGRPVKEMMAVVLKGGAK